jgi:osmotically-inducible protein OsmY
MYLKGVTAVSNTISLTSTVPTADLRTVIEAAILRSAQLDTDKITVTVDGGHVTLRGSVRSWTGRRQAEYLAWSAAGVAGVQNDLAVTA